MLDEPTNKLPNPAAVSRQRALTEAADSDDRGWAARKRFGKALDAGFQIVPDVLLRAQSALGLDVIDLAIILNITMHWWNAEDLPYPRPLVIAKRIGVKRRTVERHIAKMTERGLLRRLPAERTRGRLSVRRFDLTGLIRQLGGLAAQNLADRPESEEIF